jgi:hypothetical protein
MFKYRLDASKLIPIMLSKAPVQLLSSAPNPLPLHFPTLYPLSNVSIPEGRAALPRNLQNRKNISPPLNVVSLPPPPHFIFSLWLSRCSDRLQAERPGFDPRHGQEIFVYSTPSRPALGLIQPPIQWVK